MTYSTTPAVPTGLDAFGTWFSETINLWSARWPFWLLAILIASGVPVALNFAVSFVTGIAEEAAGDGAMLYVAGAVNAIASLLISALGIWLSLGMMVAALKACRGEMPEIGDLFSAKRLFWHGVLLSLLVGLLNVAGVLALCVGVLLVPGLVFLAMPILVDQKVNAVEAIAQSWRTAISNFWLFVLFALAVGIVSGLGVLACGIGVLATAAWFPIAQAVVYTRIFGQGAVPGMYAATGSIPPPYAPPPLISSTPSGVESQPAADPALCPHCGARKVEGIAQCPLCGVRW